MNSSCCVNVSINVYEQGQSQNEYSVESKELEFMFSGGLKELEFMFSGVKIVEFIKFRTNY